MCVPISYFRFPASNILSSIPHFFPWVCFPRGFTQFSDPVRSVLCKKYLILAPDSHVCFALIL